MKKKLLILIFLTTLNYKSLFSAADNLSPIDEYNNLLYQKYVADCEVKATSEMVEIKEDTFADMANKVIHSYSAIISHEQWTLNCLQLIDAACAGNLKRVTELLLAGQVNINYVESNHVLTALIVASFKNNIEIVDLLLKNGADPDLKNKDGWTALIFAATKGFTEVARLLLNAGAKVNIKDNEGRTALGWAYTLNQRDIVTLISSHTPCCDCCTIQ